jgi:hypothetical protein
MFIMSLKKVCVSGLATVLFVILLPICVLGLVEKTSPPGEAVVPIAVSPALPQPKTETLQSRAQDQQSRAVLAGSPPQYSYRNQTISEDLVWRGEVLIEGGVIIAPQATLTVEAGTVVRFRRADEDGGGNPLLLVQGRILAAGTKERPVLFTSIFVEPLAGDWQGIVVMASEKKNLLENCRITGAETGIEALFSTITLKNTFFASCATGARFQDCLAVMTGGGASSCGVGVSLLQSEADLRDGNFSANRQAVVAVETSLYLGGATFSENDQEALQAENSRIRVNGNSFSFNGSGISLSLCEGAVAANRIMKNRDCGLSLAKSRVKVTGNEIVENGKLGLRVEDGKGAAWGNTFAANGEYDIYNAGTDDFKALGNWWGDAMMSAIAPRIFDQRSNPGRGRVFYLPVLRSKPQSNF